jgi:lipoprotein NlpD
VRGDSHTYVVRPGDTLYSIAWRHNLDYRDLARWNDMPPDHRIAVGQILSLRPGPYAAHRSPAAPPGPQAAPSSSAATPHPTPASPPLSSVPPSTAPVPLGPNARGWVWPTAHAGPARPVQGGGILLLGELGQPVRAAYAGRVAYVGNGIRGYGNLIIIKHGENLLTAYAHTRELSVHEGQEVAGGQLIAQMGLGPHQIAALYFEVRLNGKPVDPMPYLAGSK